MYGESTVQRGVDVVGVPGFYRVVDDFFTPAECAQWTAQAEACGFRAASTDYPPSYRRKRAEVLRQFLERQPLYRTAALAARFEAAARENLRCALGA